MQIYSFDFCSGAKSAVACLPFSPSGEDAQTLMQSMMSWWMSPPQWELQTDSILRPFLQEIYLSEFEKSLVIIILCRQWYMMPENVVACAKMIMPIWQEVLTTAARGIGAWVKSHKVNHSERWIQLFLSLHRNWPTHWCRWLVMIN